MNKLTPLLLLSLVVLGCGQFRAGQSGNANTANTAEKEAADAERSKKYFEIYQKRAELGAVPAKVELTTEPYLKGKVLFLKTRKSQPPDVVNPTPVKDKYSPDPPPSDADVLKPVMAYAIDEIDTIVLIENELYKDGCKEVDRGMYETKDGKALMGSVQVCEVTIIDRSTGSVIFKKKFEGELKERASVNMDVGYVLAGVKPKEIYDYLAGLPRK